MGSVRDEEYWSDFDEEEEGAVGGIQQVQWTTPTVEDTWEGRLRSRMGRMALVKKKGKGINGGKTKTKLQIPLIHKGGGQPPTFHGHRWTNIISSNPSLPLTADAGKWIYAFDETL